MQVVADSLCAVNMTMVVQGLLDDTTALREDTVGVRVPAVIVHRVENIVVQIERPAGYRATQRAAAGESTHSAVDELADTLTDCRDYWVQVEGVQRIVDHYHQIFQPRFEEDLRGDVRDKQRHTVN